MSRTLRWWRIRYRLRSRARFYLRVVLTVVVIAYVLVPWVTQFVETLVGYDPSYYYEPKDPQREEHLLRTQPSGRAETFRWETALKLGLLILVGLLWMFFLSTTPWGTGSRFFRR